MQHFLGDLNKGDGMRLDNLPLSKFQKDDVDLSHRYKYPGVTDKERGSNISNINIARLFYQLN